MCENTKHPHYDTIVAFINGEQIEWYNTFGKRWEVVTTPAFFSEYKYRVKLKTQKLYYRNYLCKGLGGFYVGIAWGKEDATVLSTKNPAFIKWLGETQEYEVL
jgi:hypothetical protein